MKATKFLNAVNCLLTISLSLASLTPVLAQTTIPATRGLEDSGLDQFVAALQVNDTPSLANWFQSQANRYQTTTIPIELQFRASMNYLKSQVEAPNFAQLIFREQMKLRKYIQPSTTSALKAERVLYALMQNLLEESVMKQSQNSAENQFIFKAGELSPEEKRLAGKINGAEVIPGDVLIQIGASYLSSHFIAHSQSSPGFASHGFVVSKGGAQPEVLEALIEDGVNRRDPTTARLARLWVLSLSHFADRTKAAASAADFISKEQIPFVAQGKYGTASPLLYDSTMNPNRKKEGAYFCTALVQEIYLRAGLASDQIPYLEDTSNWNWLSGPERSIYQELNIKSDRIPAPGDVLMQPEFQIRTLVLDAEGLRVSRRLRAVIDAFYDLLNHKPELKSKLLNLFRQIPFQEVNKKQVLEALDQFLKNPSTHAALPAANVAKIASYRAELEQSLPQTANLRQIAFFMLLNNLIQDRALSDLKNYEEKNLKRHALPTELRGQASLFLQNEMSKLFEALKIFSKLSF